MVHHETVQAVLEAEQKSALVKDLDKAFSKIILNFSIRLESIPEMIDDTGGIRLEVLKTKYSRICRGVK